LSTAYAIIDQWKFAKEGLLVLLPQSNGKENQAIFDQKIGESSLFLSCGKKLPVTCRANEKAWMTTALH
jgi:hypothetical protein